MCQRGAGRSYPSTTSPIVAGCTPRFVIHWFAENEGSRRRGVPDYHWDLMGRHRAEWPALWKAIDALVDALHAPKGTSDPRLPRLSISSEALPGEELTGAAEGFDRAGRALQQAGQCDQPSLGPRVITSVRRSRSPSGHAPCGARAPLPRDHRPERRGSRGIGRPPAGASRAAPARW